MQLLVQYSPTCFQRGEDPLKTNLLNRIIHPTWCAFNGKHK